MQLFYHVCLATAALCQHRGLTFVSPSGDVSDRNLGPKKRTDWQQQHEQLLSDEVWTLVIEKQDLLLICYVFVLFRADICDQQISGTWVFLLWFLLIPLKCMQDLFSAYTTILTSIFSSPLEPTDLRCSQNGQRQGFVGKSKFGPWKNLSDIFLPYPTIINQLK